ncbi:MAG: HAD family hydrolase [Victivallales bacterium]|nr:HAD family hydrolase [Victivallales bacterium]
MRLFNDYFTVQTPRYPRSEMRPALFVDRDDTLIADVPYLNEPSKVELLPGTIEGLRLFQEAGYRLIMISNQSGIGRGSIRMDQLLAVQTRIAEILGAEGIAFDAMYFCPHAPDVPCSCRKPEPGMILGAMRDFATDAAASLMVGDREADVKAGLAAGVKNVHYLRFPESTPHPEAACAVRNLAEAFRWMRQNKSL